MAFEVPLDEIDTDNVGGFDKVLDGGYHLEITGYDEDGGRKGEMLVDAEVLRGTTPNQEGKSIRFFFGKELKPLAIRKILALAIASGVTTKQELDKHKAAGTSPSLDFSNIVGKQICANIETSESGGKSYTGLAWDEIFYPADKRANHIPLLMAKINAAKIVLPEGRNPDGLGGSVVKPKGPASPKPDASKQASNVDALL